MGSHTNISSTTIAIGITVVAADRLLQRDVFKLPDPFAFMTVDSVETFTTSVLQDTLNPYWNESFDINIQEESVITIRIFDQKRMKKQDSGFLGLVDLHVEDYMNVRAGRLKKEVFRLKLRKSSDNLSARGELIVRLSMHKISHNSSRLERPQSRVARAFGPESLLPSAVIEPSRPRRSNSFEASSPSSSPALPVANRARSDLNSNGQPGVLRNLPSIASSPFATDSVGSRLWTVPPVLEAVTDTHIASSSRSPSPAAWPNATDMDNVRDISGRGLSVEGLPYEWDGWERAVDRFGRVFYINHNTPITTWTSPYYRPDIGSESARTDADTFAYEELPPYTRCEMFEPNGYPFLRSQSLALPRTSQQRQPHMMSRATGASHLDLPLISIPGQSMWPNSRRRLSISDLRLLWRRRPHRS